jgi:hypothetical protein
MMNDIWEAEYEVDRDVYVLEGQCSSRMRCVDICSLYVRLATWLGL